MSGFEICQVDKVPFTTNGCELGRVNAKRDALREQIIRVARRILYKAVSTPFFTRSGIVAPTLGITRAGAGFHQPTL